MTDQEMFNKIVTHLLTQKVRSESTDADGTTTCLYRGPDGAKCAVGVLIADEHYTPSLESRVVTSWPVSKALVASGVISAHSPRTQMLLAACQGVHDATHPRQWKDRLTELAEEYNLTMPEVAA